jgi:hypothetical protein
LRNTNSYLAESVAPIGHGNLLTGRAELLDKDDLFSNDPDLESTLEARYSSTFRTGAYTIGFTHDVDWFRNVETGIGANFTPYTLPAAIKPSYGSQPVGGNVYLRVRLGHSNSW